MARRTRHHRGSRRGGIDDRQFASDWLTRRWPEALAAAVPLLFATVFRNAVPGPDVAWQLWIAHQIRLGARLYVDIVETNPPLWFWEAVPLDAAASLLRIPSHVLLIAAIGAAASLSVWRTGRLVDDIPAPWRAALLVYIALTLVLMPLIDTGQREQIVLIVALPYATLAAARRRGRRVPAPWAAAIGAAAFFGLALKHYFLIAPGLIEIGLLAGRRHAYRPIRPETVACIGLGLGYALAALAITPDFFTQMLPLDRIAYARIGGPRFDEMIRPIQIYWLIALAPLLLSWRALRGSPEATALMIAALGFALGWLIQFRGFPYHSIPATGCLMIAFAFVVVGDRPRLPAAIRVTAPTILLLPLGFAAWYGPYRADFVPIVRPMLRDLGPHDPVAFVSDQAIFSWPLSLYRDAPYPSRQYGMWMLRAVAFDRGGTPALAGIGRQLVEQTAQDYRCTEPVRIIFSRKPVGPFLVEDYFLANPLFAALMRHYRYLGRYRMFDVYQLVRRFPPPPASACRRSY